MTRAIHAQRSRFIRSTPIDIDAALLLTIPTAFAWPPVPFVVTNVHVSTSLFEHDDLGQARLEERLAKTPLIGRETMKTSAGERLAGAHRAWHTDIHFVAEKMRFGRVRE
jgi:hypothetical protein